MLHLQGGLSAKKWCKSYNSNSNNVLGPGVDRSRKSLQDANPCEHDVERLKRFVIKGET